VGQTVIAVVATHKEQLAQRSADGSTGVRGRPVFGKDASWLAYDR
jgi:hypothetical protein